MSIVLGGKTRGRRRFWIPLLASRAFSLRARMRDDDAKASASDDTRDALQQRPEAATNKRHLGPTSGEDADFDAFFAQHERALYGYLRRMLLTHEAALDVAQEAFFRAWQRFEMLRGYDRPQAWLFRVATNLAFDTLRRRQPIGLSRLFSQRAAATSSDSDASDAIPALTDPFDMERSLADRDLVNQALERLPARQRAAVLLWAAHGLT
ncbi:MAG: RNA polymerase sigma factor, partial [Nitrososphaerota archaeon]